MFIWILHRLCLQYIVKKDTCDDTSTYIARLDFTPFRIENAQRQRVTFHSFTPTKLAF